MSTSIIIDSDLAYWFTIGKKGQPVMRGLFVNAERQEIAATDGRLLLTRPIGYEYTGPSVAFDLAGKLHKHDTIVLDMAALKKNGHRYTDNSKGQPVKFTVLPSSDRKDLRTGYPQYEAAIPSPDDAKPTTTNGLDASLLAILVKGLGGIGRAASRVKLEHHGALLPVKVTLIEQKGNEAIGYLMPCRLEQR